MSNDDDPTTRIIGAPKPAAAPSTEDGDATVIRVPTGGRTAPPAATPAQPPPVPRVAAPTAAGEGGNMLPVGTFLGEFEVTDMLGEGGFGIVYLARDHSLHRRVALKEYMPSSLAARVGGTQVQVKSERHRETFEAGLHSFVNEARLLASFDHPSLVKVYRFWEANGTAYMVMPFYEGITLKQKLKEMEEPPDEAWLRDLLEPLTEALAVIHAEQCYHRDIAPDNVILLKGSNRPLLLDFGAARRVIGDMTQALTVILKPGYAPVEQYAEVPGMKQGPWTDVYALAAVVYFAVLGKTPPTSVGRLMNDSYVPMTEAAAGRYGEGFLAAIDRALAVKPDDRTPSIDALRTELGMEALDPAQPGSQRTRVGPGTRRAALPPSKSGAASGGDRRGLVIAGIALVAVVAVAGCLYAWLGGESATTSKSSTGGEAATSVALPAAPTASGTSGAPNAAPDAAPPPTVATTSGTTVAPTSTVPTGALPPVAETGPLDPPRDFERIAAGQAPDFHVDATFVKPRFRIGKDNIAFTVKSEKDGYLYVLQHGTDDAIIQVFPNQIAKNNRIRAGQSLTLPPEGSEWVLQAGGPAGTDTMIAIVSANPRDYASTGMKYSDRFLQTTRAAAAEVARREPSGKPFFLGKPECREPCDDIYGARVVTAEEVK
jgi:hypothetical protein